MAERFPDFVERMVFRYRNGRFTFKLVSSTLAGMRHFVGSDFDYFVNLSGECYPIRSQDVIHKRLTGPVRSFIEARKYPDEEIAKHKLERFSYWHLTFYVGSVRHTYRLRRFRQSMPEGMQPYGGSQWFCMHRKHVKYVLDYCDRHPDVQRYLRHVGVPDENFFQTIVMNSGFQSEVVKDNLRHIAWVPSNSMGATFPEGETRYLTISDFHELMSSEALWARKFDISVDPVIMDEIDRRCLDAVT